jgi:hypothetical protein
MAVLRNSAHARYQTKLCYNGTVNKISIKLNQGRKQ